MLKFKRKLWIITWKRNEVVWVEIRVGGWDELGEVARSTEQDWEMCPKDVEGYTHGWEGLQDHNKSCVVQSRCSRKIRREIAVVRVWISVLFLLCLLRRQHCWLFPSLGCSLTSRHLHCAKSRIRQDLNCSHCFGLVCCWAVDTWLKLAAHLSWVFTELVLWENGVTTVDAACAIL